MKESVVTEKPLREHPLQDVRVVEMGQLLAGPFCGQLLGDFGADVVKLEPPGVGDPIRKWGRTQVDGQPLWWPIVGRNKRSVTCDLRTPEGQEIARRLIERADVVVENFRPGTLENWSLDYESLSSANPGLIMVRVSGFGQSGPYRNRPGYGSIGEAMGGLRYVTGHPELAPSRCGISIGDSLTATFACLGALVALHDRERTGRGQVVDAAIFESVLAVMESLIPEWVLGGVRRERTGAQLPGVAPSNAYPTASGDMILIAANADSVFSRLLHAMGHHDLAEDAEFVDHDSRTSRVDDIDRLIGEWTRGQDTADCLKHLEAAGVPAGLIYTAAEMVADPHFAARESITHVSHDRYVDFPMQNVFPRLSASPGGIRWTGATLGEHTDEVLAEAGFTTSDVAAMRETGVI
jgi:succinyl-CoA---D-citramalate CoA-transferase